MRKKTGLRRYAGLTGIVAAAALVFAGIALGVSGAVSTTDNHDVHRRQERTPIRRA